MSNETVAEANGANNGVTSTNEVPPAPDVVVMSTNEVSFATDVVVPSVPPPPTIEITNGHPEHANGTSPDNATELRLRMKVWTDAKTGQRYLMPSAIFRDVVKGRPISDAMYAYGMRDEDTRLIQLTCAEWNALPYYYFREDGSAPRASTVPPTAIPSA